MWPLRVSFHLIFKSDLRSTLKYGWNGTATANTQTFNTIFPAVSDDEQPQISRPSTHAGKTLSRAPDILDFDFCGLMFQARRYKRPCDWPDRHGGAWCQ